MAETCLTEFNERTSVIVTVSFVDENGDPAVPTSATYRVDNEATKTNIVPQTAIGSLATSVDILITSDQNYIVRPRNKSEVRTVTVEFDYTGSLGAMHGTAKYQYRLMNLYGVVDVPSPSTSPSASASPSV